MDILQPWISKFIDEVRLRARGGNEEIKEKRGKGKLKREKGGGGKEEMKSFLGDMDVIDLLGPGIKKGL